MDELFCVEVGQGRDPEVCAADQLGQNAAGPERDERAEHRVLNDAGEQLGASADQRLHDQRPSDPLGCSPNLVVGLQVQGDTAALGLVRTRGRLGIRERRDRRVRLPQALGVPSALTTTASTGLSGNSPTSDSRTAAATSSAPATTGGTKRTITASIPGSRSRCGRTCAYVS